MLQAAAGAGVSVSGSDDEWYTPRIIIQGAIALMGVIDLDPASSAAANEIVGAADYFTVEDDGLSQPWKGRVWLNPPYSYPLIGQLSVKVIEEFRLGNVTEACMLTNNVTETDWFQKLVEASSAFCLLDDRVLFQRPGPKRPISNGRGQTLFYFGPNPALFQETFGHFGKICALRRRSSGPRSECHDGVAIVL